MTRGDIVCNVALCALIIFALSVSVCVHLFKQGRVVLSAGTGDI